LQERYQTYGQHSFIYDFVAAASWRRIDVSLLVDGLDAFPLAKPLAVYCDVTEFMRNSSPIDADLILLDQVSGPILAELPADVPAFCLVHNAGAVYPSSLHARCDKLVCMTERSFALQQRNVDTEKLVLIHQGVDTHRFNPHPVEAGGGSEPRVLLYTRMEAAKRNVVISVVDKLLSTDIRLTVVGDGEVFWEISDTYGETLTLINHIPCHSIHNFLPRFEAVISSGRGAMEALACGLPTLCAGFEYGGLITPKNIRAHMRTNLTGFAMGRDVSAVGDEVRAATAFDRLLCREMAEQYCSVDLFLDRLLETFVCVAN
jgi:glycosyltransferase involved in cell wall biosynthesis